MTFRRTRDRSLIKTLQTDQLRLKFFFFQFHRLRRVIAAFELFKKHNWL